MKLKAILFGIFVGLFTLQTQANTIIYVDAAANGAQNGTSWPNAYRHLGPALDTAPAGAEIRVAQGNYFPNEGYTSSPSGNYRNFSFRLPVNGTLRGGYAGVAGENPNEQSVKDYRTYLSANIVITRDPFTFQEQHAYHVVTGASDAVLDGVFLGNAQANGQTITSSAGGGIYCNQTDMTVMNCMLSGNEAVYGGGIYALNADVRVVNCLIICNNAVANGGAVYAQNANVELINCTMTGNEAEGHGRTVFAQNASVDIVNTIVWGTTRENPNMPPRTGAHLSIMNNASIVADHSCIQYGEEAIERDADSTVVWDNSNITSSPEFWCMHMIDFVYNPLSAYSLMGFVLIPPENSSIISPCIDAGLNLPELPTADMSGQDRICNNTVDMGAFESQQGESLPEQTPQELPFTIEKMSLTGSSRAGIASFTIQGQFNISWPSDIVHIQDFKYHPILADILTALQSLTLNVGPFSLTSDMYSPIVVHRSSNNFIYLDKISSGGLVQLNINPNTGVFTLKLTNVDLAGLAAPLYLSFSLNSNLLGVWEETVELTGDDLLQLGVTIPLSLQAGNTDALSVDDARCFQSSRPRADMLIVRGGLCLDENPADPTAEDIILTYGTYQLTLPADNLQKFGTNGLLARLNNDNTFALILINPDRMNFQAIILKADIDEQTEPVAFGLKFAGFDQTAIVP